MTLFFLWLFMFGAVIGSFLNVVILRYERGESLSGRSHCPHCGHTLTWRELVPVVSYLVQRGRCRTCGERISPQYALVEAATGLLFVLIAYIELGGLVLQNVVFGDAAALALHLAVWATLAVITVYDLRTKLIPDVFSYTFIGLAFVLQLLLAGTGSLPFSWWWLAAGPFFYAPYWLLWKVSDGAWIGLGDAKLSWGIGWYLGPALGGTAILCGFWIGAFVSLALIGYGKLRTQGDAERTRLTLKSEVPFGPYLVAGAALVYVSGFNLFTLVH